MSNTAASKEKLVADLKLVVADTEELLRATAGQAGEKVAELAQAVAQCPEIARIVRQRRFWLPFRLRLASNGFMQFGRGQVNTTARPFGDHCHQTLS